MTSSIAELFDRLSPDPWRDSVPFSADIETVNRQLFSQDWSSNDAVPRSLRDWLALNQPCLFGRIAAKRDLLTFCVLTEEDLKKSDEAIRRHIQAARLLWRRRAFEGKSSAFIITAVSERIATARPDQHMLKLARRLFELYLLEDITTDRVFTDSIFLEKPGPSQTTWKWLVGANYFCAQGDRRWWHDHRIPGGMAFSMNSVGHMVKSGILGRAMSELDAELGTAEEHWGISHVDSLPKALVLAMRTIANAAETPWGRATELLREEGQSKCPIELPQALSGFSCSQYSGFYHTDFTLPSEYFQESDARPAEIGARALDFTYLFDRQPENVDFIRMGEGEPIRESDFDRYAPAEKVKRASEVEVPITSDALLVEALRR